MDSKLKNFQTVLLIVLGVGLAVGLMIFGNVIKVRDRGGDTIQASGSVSIWGPFSASDGFSALANAFNQDNQNIKISYTAKSFENYDSDLLEAFASGTAPDIILLPHSLASRYDDKVIVLNETALPERSFKDLYSQGSEVFRTPGGTIGLPFGVDPLVMYFNNDILESGGFIQPPKFWNGDFLDFVQTITEVETDGLNISLSAAGLGTVYNIPHATEIISTLIMQLGNPITFFDDGIIESSVRESSPFVGTPTQTALSFYTQFSDPSDDLYTWNKAFPTARDSFTSEQTGIYFGFASELLDIQRKNPNLNFDVAPIPQIQELNKKLTYGEFYALAVPKTSQNIEGAFAVVGALTAGSYSSQLLQATNLQPVRRDLLAITPTNPYQKIFYDSAIIARGWFNPNPVIVDSIFSDVVDSINSGRLTPSRAVNEIDQKINDAF